MGWPELPARAAYLTISNPQRRNALSVAVLRSLRDQLHAYTAPTGRGPRRLLPAPKPQILAELEAAQTGGNNAAAVAARERYGWLVDAETWRRERAGLPHVLVLRAGPGPTPGPVFSSGHDLAELRRLPAAEVRGAFALCAEVMGLLRRFPGPVVSAVRGLATAAGAQLALSADVPLACASDAVFQLPGAALGLPCTSPATAASRRLGSVPFAYRLAALAEPVPADALPAGGAVEVVHGADAFEARLRDVVALLAARPAQPQALGKWAFYTQAGIRGDGGDGYAEAAEWAGRVMALHVRSEDALEGMDAFLEKRAPVWKT